jgi:ElaA protein
MTFIIKSFDQLTNHELYYLLKLRYDVFVKEQQSLYDEFDNLDQKATHFLLFKGDQLIGYSRCYRKSSSVGTFGRVVIHPDFRSHGYGRQLIQKSITHLSQNPQLIKISISAQTYLQKLYQSLGFTPSSDPYDDAGVTHLDMELILKHI